MTNNEQMSMHDIYGHKGPDEWMEPNGQNQIESVKRNRMNKRNEPDGQMEVDKHRTEL
jgi:hypothetical protein